MWGQKFGEVEDPSHDCIIGFDFPRGQVEFGHGTNEIESKFRHHTANFVIECYKQNKDDKRKN